MKFSKVLASVAAATVAVSTLAVSAFAADALVSMTVAESGKPSDAGQVNLWELPFDESVYTWAGDVDKAVATITSQAYANGAFGANTVAADGWAASAQVENSAAGTNEWVWDGIGGLKSGLDEDGKETGYFKVEVWWMNAQDDGSAATLTVDKVDFYNKNGDLLATYPVADETPADPAEPAEPGETEKPAEPAAPADVTIANSGKTVIDDGFVRTNIINSWAKNDACVIADEAAFAGANKVSVKFTVTNFTKPFKAWIAMMDSTENCQFWGADNAGNKGANGTVVDVTGNGTYVVTVDLDNVIDSMKFIAVCTDLKAAEGDAIPTIAIDQVKINEEITVKPGDSTEPTKPGTSDLVKPGDCSGEPVNPPTGAAVAVIPAALAAAAVATTGIVLKKRSK